MSANDDLMGALGRFIAEGHSFVLAPAKKIGWIGGTTTQASVSGPSGSRSALGDTPAAALESLIVQIVEARLMGEVPPARESVRELMKRTFC